MSRNALSRLVALAAAGLFSVPHLCAAQADDPAVFSPLPVATSIKTAADGARILRQLYFIGDYDDGAALGDSLYRRFPSNARLRAWYVGNLTRTARVGEAAVLTARIDTTSRDPWTLASRVFALMYDPEYRRAAFAQAFRLAERARRLAPRDPDFAWLAVLARFNDNDNKWASVVAFVDSVASQAGNPAELQVVRANALYYLAFAKPPIDTAKREEAYRAYAAARATDTSNFNGIYLAANRLEGVHNDEALALITRAVARSPRSTTVRTEYWSVINAQKNIPAEERKAQIAADRTRFLALTDSVPWALASAINSMRSHNEAGISALEDRLLAKAPRSGWAENVLLSRARQWDESLSVARDTTRAGPRPDSAAMKSRARQALEDFINRPWHANDEKVGEAALFLFLSVRNDSTYPTDKLVKAVKLMVAGGLEPNATVTHLDGAVALADRKVELRYAEQLVQEGGKLAGETIMHYPDFVFSTIGEREDAMNAADAQTRDARGWIYFNEGRITDAETEFEKSLDLSKKRATTYYHIGRMRSAQGRAEDAELSFAQGMTVHERGTNPNRRELETIYKKNHGSLEGWAPYLATLEEKERTNRRAKILETQAKEPKAAKTFLLANLEGRTVSSDSLKGRYAVVNLWGTWCGPCVAEMPELQQFYDKYRGDSSVSVLTISNDKDLQDLKDWMTKRKLTIPTLWDAGNPGYVGSTGVAAWPTTWFIDRDGKIQFTAIGNSGALVEEWSWRLEAMRSPRVTLP
jgi:thiol-disulfide isomerase/thioredoxin